MASEQDKLLRDVLSLPPEARAALAAQLIDSLDTEVDPDSEAAWGREIAKRVEDVRSGQVKLVPWSEARARIMGKPNGRKGR